MTKLTESREFELAVVIPIYNEGECIAEVLESWVAMLEELDVHYTLLALDDGSTDNTAGALQAYDEHSRIQVIQKTNSGHGPTILMGYQRACEIADWVFQVDSDNEMGPEHFCTLWANRENYDALFGVRAARKQNLVRKLITLGSRAVISTLFGPGVEDVNTPYRLIRANILKELTSSIRADVFAPNVIISGALVLRRCKLFHTPVPHQHRRTGTVSIVKWKLWRAAFLAAWQTISFRISFKHLKPEKK